MKCVLIKAPLGFDAQLRTGDMARIATFSTAPYYLAARLEQSGFDTQTIDPAIIDEDFLKSDEFRSSIESADLVGLSVETSNLFTTRIIVAQIKQIQPDCLCLIGGIHGTYYPEETLRFTGADYLLTGESDHDLVAFCQALEARTELNPVPNLHWIDNNCRYHGKAFTYTVTDLTTLPWKLRLDDLPERMYHMAPFETSRGCPFSCTFCSNYSRRLWRGRTPEAVIEQLTVYINEVKQKVVTNGIIFIDECFTTNPQRAINILNGITRQRITVPLALSARVPELLHNPALIDSLSEVKPYSVSIGVECGYDAGLERVQKGFKTSDVVSCLELLASHHLTKSVFLSFIIGLPFEDMEQIEQTVSFAAYCVERFDCSVTTVWWIPFPSQLWDALPSFGITPVFKHFYLPPLERYYKLFHHYHSRLSQADVERVGHLLQLCYNLGTPLLEIHPLPLYQPVEW